MSHFYGTIKGTKGEATRCGHVSSGLRTEAASWSGAVRVELSVRGDVDWADVYLIPWQGQGVRLRLYEGPIDGPKITNMDDALRCRTCVGYANWQAGEQRAKAHCEPDAPEAAEA